jgi:hypothetical protein
MTGATMHTLAAIAIAGLILGATPARGQPAPDAAVPDSAAPNDDTTLALICWGQGRKPNSTYSSGYAWNSDSNKFVPKTYVYSSTQRFDSEVQIELYGNAGRIHLTGKLIPPTHSGGTNGWWSLYDMQVTPERITGRYRMNSVNKPKVEIDRRTGQIRIDGIEKFKGECDQGNWGQRGARF